MVKVYLGLDQPFTALRLLQDADVEFNGDGLAAESFWRLGMFEELDKMLSRPDVSIIFQILVKRTKCLLIKKVEYFNCRLQIMIHGG